MATKLLNEMHDLMRRRHRSVHTERAIGSLGMFRCRAALPGNRQLRRLPLRHLDQEPFCTKNFSSRSLMRSLASR